MGKPVFSPDNDGVEGYSVSWGTLLSSDLVDAFTSELERRDAQAAARIYGEHSYLYDLLADDRDEFDFGACDDVPWLVDALFDALDDCAPFGTRFGANEGDGADFGFWPSMELEPDMEI